MKIFDFFRYSIDFEKLCSWILLIPLQKILFSRVITSCPFGGNDIDPMSDGYKCRAAPRYASLTVFQKLCPDAESKVSGKKVMCHDPLAGFEFSFWRFVKTGIVVCGIWGMFWGGSAFGVYSLYKQGIIKVPRPQIMTEPQQVDAKKAGEFINQAEKYQMAGEFRKAVIAYKNAWRWDPENPEIHYALGICFLELKEGRPTFDSLTKAVELDPEMGKAHLKLGVLWALSGEREKAWHHAEQAKKLNAESAEFYLLLAACHEMNGENEKAIELLDKTLLFKDTTRDIRLHAASLLYQLKDYEKAGAVYSDLVKSQPDDLDTRFKLAVVLVESKQLDAAEKQIQTVLEHNLIHPEARMMQCNLWMARGEMEKAVTEWELLTAELPENTEIRNRFAAVLFQTGRPNRGIEQALRVLETNPDDPDASALLGTFYNTRRLWTPAIQYAEAGLRENPDHARLKRILVTAYMGKQEFYKAEKQLESLLEEHPDNINLKTMRCMALNGQGHEDLALTCLQEISDQHPKAVRPYILTARIHMQLKDFSSAIAVYENIMKQHPDHMAALNNLAEILAEHTDQINRAVKLARKVKKKYSDNPAVADTYGWILYKTGNHKKALPELKYAAQKMPNRPMVRYHLGAVYHKTGNHGQAKIELEAALSLSKNFPKAEEAVLLLASLKK